MRRKKGSHAAVFVSSRNAVWDHTWLRDLKQILRIAAGQNQVVRSIQVDTQATGLVDKPEGSRILFPLCKSITWSISEGEERALIAIHALSTTTVRYRAIAAQRHHHTLPLTERLQWELRPIPRFARIRAGLRTPAVFRCWATYYDGNDICKKKRRGICIISKRQLNYLKHFFRNTMSGIEKNNLCEPIRKCECYSMMLSSTSFPHPFPRRSHFEVKTLGTSLRFVPLPRKPSVQH